MPELMLSGERSTPGTSLHSTFNTHLPITATFIRVLLQLTRLRCARIAAGKMKAGDATITTLLMQEMQSLAADRQEGPHRLINNVQLQLLWRAFFKGKEAIGWEFWCAAVQLAAGVPKLSIWYYFLYSTGLERMHCSNP